MQLPRIRTMEQLIAAVPTGEPMAMVVAGAEAGSVREALGDAVAHDWVRPILCCTEAEVTDELRAQADAWEAPLLVAPDLDEMLHQVVLEIGEGRAQLAMKGNVSTAKLLRRMLQELMGEGLHGRGRLTHQVVLECPAVPRLLMNTDGGVIPHPTPEDFQHILLNCRATLESLRIERPRIALIAGAEVVTRSMPETVVFDELRQWAEATLDWCDVDGPMGLDVALSRHAAIAKGLVEAGPVEQTGRPVCGHADVLMTPNITAGNVFGKTAIHMGQAHAAGLVVGGPVPIVLLSRADDAATKLRSIALGRVVAEHLHETVSAIG